jgi:lipoate-protein ligase A
MKFRLIIDPPRSASLNMALDEVLAGAQTEAETLPSLRFYGWERPAVTVGYFEDVQRAAKRFQAEKNDMSVVRRLTGGGAVHHGRDLTFSLCLRLPSSHVPMEVKSSYLKINEAIRLGLTQDYPGIDYADCRKTPSVSASHKERVCFDKASCYDLLLDGKKILGASQRRIGRTMLHQSTLFLEGDNAALTRKVIRGFRDLWKIEFIEGPFTNEELRLAGKIERERYEAKDWAYLPSSFLRAAAFFS